MTGAGPAQPPKPDRPLLLTTLRELLYQAPPRPARLMRWGRSYPGESVRNLEHGTLADLHTLMSHPPHMRRGNTWIYKGQPNPAAGSGWIYTVPPDWWIRIMTLGFTFTADATVQNRYANLVFADGDGTALDTNPAITLAIANQVTPVTADQQLPPGPPSNISATGYGTATAPGAATNLVNLTGLPPGLYAVSWTVEVSGTLTAGTDNDNFRVLATSNASARSVNPATAGPYPQQPLTTWVGPAANVQLQNIGAATAGAVYAGSVTATCIQPSPVQAQIPDLVLKSGSSIAIAAGNFHSGDQLSNIVMMAERYPSNWADGSLDSDEERQLRQLASLLAGDGYRM